ncbi:MAG: site-2 protease family protein [Planctomycetaceae bacterium]|nr:MAG: site-2 protease family protein [Planctomycetaceae bacterium]
MNFTITPELFEQIQYYACFAIVMLGSLTIHEFAHARIALAFGDPTAYKLGRVSLNPIRHLDPMGTILFIFAQVGWGKPVPVNIYLMRPPSLGNICTSAGGPLSNLAVATVSLACMKLVTFIPAIANNPNEPFYKVLDTFLWLSFAVNIGLFVFNLIPLYPLDGHHILGEFLPDDMQEGYMRFQLSMGVYIMIALWVGPRILRQITGDPNIPNPVRWLIDSIRSFVYSLVM